MNVCRVDADIYLELSFLIFLPSVKVIKRAQYAAARVVVSYGLDVTVMILLVAVVIRCLLVAWVMSEENFAFDPELGSLRRGFCCLQNSGFV